MPSESDASRYDTVVEILRDRPRRWLVTGAAGFIGSHLVERLLSIGQTVIGLDNLATGRKSNLNAVETALDAAAWRRFEFRQADVRDSAACAAAVDGVDDVLHQAALGSVPRSIADPLATHDVNVTGTLNLINASRLAGVRTFTYASSSSVYGDNPDLPKREGQIGRALSPYAASKRAVEVYADAMRAAYGFRCIGLRYFNVFGVRQDPAGAYAAVIPRWITQMRRGKAVTIFGDGETSRDFCHIENVIRANLLAAQSSADAADPTGVRGPTDEPGRVFNIACGRRTTLNDLAAAIGTTLDRVPTIRYEAFRVGDVRHSLAGIDAARDDLGYRVAVDFETGIRETVAAWSED